MISAMGAYKKYSDADKAAVKELRAELVTSGHFPSEGHALSLQDVIRVVEPGFDNPPEYGLL